MLVVEEDVHPTPHDTGCRRTPFLRPPPRVSAHVRIQLAETSEDQGPRRRLLEEPGAKGPPVDLLEGTLDTCSGLA